MLESFLFFRDFDRIFFIFDRFIFFCNLKFLEEILKIHLLFEDGFIEFILIILVFIMVLADTVVVVLSAISSNLHDLSEFPKFGKELYQMLMIDTEYLCGMHAPFSFYIVFIFVIYVKQKTGICKVATFI